MKTIFDETSRNEIINRIQNVQESSPRQWGKMNAYQMVKHCALWDAWILGKNEPVYKQAIIGRLFGKMALRKMIRNNDPLDRNIPTSNWLKLKETSGNMAVEKSNWIALVNEYATFSNPAFIHDFFGKMTREEIGILVYKHTDHHLRQFNT